MTRHFAASARAVAMFDSRVLTAKNEDILNNFFI
jgi:hypothetical protein